MSGWKLARAVSRAGQLGVVAGTALDVILARRLQQGDPGGHFRRALARFPVPGVAERILDQFFLPHGKDSSTPFRAIPLLSTKSSGEREDLIVAANFAEVFLAKENHTRLIGINFLEKIQLPTLPSIYGAMLAGVDVVLMGAGLPLSIPGVLDNFAAARTARITLDVRGSAKSSSHELHFDPKEFCPGVAPTLRRPDFYAIASSAIVASVMARKSTSQVDGLVIEESSAGGHNAPPRGPMKLDAHGEPSYGERDVVDYGAIEKLGLPFWLAGSYGTADALERAQELGAVGVQIGTPFAFCDESGITSRLKARALRRIRAGNDHVHTDPLASPTGFPFKVFELPNTMSEPGIFERREKLCDLGYLRHAYEKSDGRVGWRCPGEPTHVFLRKGGKPEEISGRKCVCNGLLANIGLAQLQPSGVAEEPLLTSGTDTSTVRALVSECGMRYSAEDVIEHILGATATAP